MNKNTNKDEIIEMNRYKWFKSEEKGFDVGPQAFLEWIDKYADIWRVLDDYSLKYNVDKKVLEDELNKEMFGFKEDDRSSWLRKNLKKWLSNRTMNVQNK
jgi:hypothetical protein